MKWSFFWIAWIHLNFNDCTLKTHTTDGRSCMFTWTCGIVALDVLVVEDSWVSLRPGDQVPSYDPFQEQAEGKHSAHPWRCPFLTNMAFHQCPKESHFFQAPLKSRQATLQCPMSVKIWSDLRSGRHVLTTLHQRLNVDWHGVGIAKYSRRSSVRRRPVSTDVGGLGSTTLSGRSSSRVSAHPCFFWYLICDRQDLNQWTTKYAQKLTWM